MSKEQNQNAPPAEAAKPEDSKASPEKASLPDFPKPPVLQIDFAKLNPDMLKTAEAIGIPLNAILTYVSDMQAWSAGIEGRVQAIIQNFSPAIKETTKETIAEMLKEAQKNMPQPPMSTAAPNVPMMQQGQGQPGLLGLLNNPLIGQLLGQVTGGNSMEKQMMELMMENFRDSIAFSKTFNNMVMQKMAGKAVGELVNAAAP